ncbi:MAG: hypothetical protein ACOY45_15585 [Pseudomonadota bacterium]
MSARGEREAERLRRCRMAFVRAQRDGVTVREGERRMLVEEGLRRIEERRARLAALRAAPIAVPTMRALVEDAGSDDADAPYWRRGQLA